MNQIVNEFLLAGDTFMLEMHLKTASNKVLRNKAFNIAKHPKYDGYLRELASMIYKIFAKNSNGSSVNIEVKHNEQLAEELHKPIIGKFKKGTVSSGFKDNIWGAI